MRDGSSDVCISKSEMEWKNYIRLLWSQHVLWTRSTIVSLVFHLPDTNFVVARLLQNATDMGNSMKPFYGEEIGNKYGNLIRSHLVIAADLVKAARDGEQKKAEAIEKKWYENGNEIVLFLNQINPYIEINEMRKMFFEHLALTKSEAVYMIQKDYKSAVAIFDAIEAEALQMADIIANAVIDQFYPSFQVY